MQIHEWITSAIVVAVGAFIYNFLRNFKTDIKQDFKEMKAEIKEMKFEIKLINDKLYSIVGGLSHIEGYMVGKDQERSFWENRKTGTEEKK